MGELGAARSVLRRVIEIAPQMAKAHTLLGYYQMQANQYEDAAESYGNAARIDIHDAAACLSLGSVLYHAGRIEEARAAWRQAIERDNSQQVKRAKQYLRRYRK
jgi:Flp pilus assembly protein TadD